MTRAGRQLAVVVGTATPLAWASSRPILATALLVLTVFLAGLAWCGRGGDGGERSWLATRTEPRPGGIEGLGRPDPPSSAGVGRSLGRLEAREFMLSPWIAIGLSFFVVMLAAFATNYEGGESLAQVADDLPFLAHPFAGMAVLAGHAAASRAARDGVEELIASCPVPARVRIRARLVLVGGVVPVVAVWAAAYLVVFHSSTPVAPDDIGAVVVLLVAAAAVLVAGGAALGELLARLTPSPLAPLLAIVAIAIASPLLAEGTAEAAELTPRMLLSTMVGISDQAPNMTAGQAGLHVLWLLTLTGLTLSAALIGPHDDQPALRAGARALRGRRHRPRHGFPGRP